MSGSITQSVTNAFNDFEAATNLFDGVIINSNQDMAASYLGYPKLTMTTGLVTYSSSGGTPIVMDSFTGAFDTVWTTTTTTGTPASAGAIAYVIAMPYTNLVCGYVVYNLAIAEASGTVGLDVSSGGTLHYPLFSSSGYPSGISDPGYGSDVKWNCTGAGTSTVVKAFCGKYFTISFVSGSGTAPSAWFRDISVYGVTNVYKNFTGTP